MSNPQWLRYKMHPDRFALGDQAPSGTFRTIADFSPRPCVTGSGDETPSEEEAIANLVLAAAAPKMKAALDEIHRRLRADLSTSELIALADIAAAASLEAEGRGE